MKYQLITTDNGQKKLREVNPHPQNYWVERDTMIGRINQEWLDFEQTALANAIVLVNPEDVPDGKGEFEESVDIIPCYHNGLDAWEYIGTQSTPAVKAEGKGEYMPSDKEEAILQQMANNMPEGVEHNKQFLEWMFRMGFENGINWHKQTWQYMDDLKAAFEAGEAF